MTEYNKLTVLKLREELVKRGLPKYGLKAELIQRLTEADAQPEHNSSSGKQETEVLQSKIDAETTDAVTGVEETSTNPVAKTQHHEERDDDAKPHSPTATAGTERESPKAVDLSSEVQTAQPVEAAPSARSHSPANAAAPDADIREKSSGDQSLASQSDPHMEFTLTSSEEVRDQSPQEGAVAATTSIAEHASLTVDIAPGPSQSSVLGSEELRDDTSKRKRRSHSPPPSSIDNARKRAKADNGRPHVKLPEDDSSRFASPSQQHRQSEDVTMDDAVTKAHPGNLVEEPQVNGTARTPKEIQSPTVAISEGIYTEPAKAATADGKAEEAKSSLLEERQRTPPPTTIAETPPKQSPSDARFKNLFTGSSKRDESPSRPRVSIVDEDRVIGPALHPATSALYIRDLLRPVNPVALKEHLSALASPPDMRLDSEIISTFFLDNVRTHCLVGFANTSAAARVRLGLHDRVWPNERNRKPLWVDFVPEEKLQKWIDVETEAASDRRMGLKKWEVIYEEENGGVMAFLQEAGPNSSAPRAVQAVPLANGKMVSTHERSSRPKTRDEDLKLSQSGPAAKSDGGKGFQALDELFKATAAKPKLYYLPVTQHVAHKRLDLLALGRGGGRSDEKRRYTFEDGALVDKGPEFGFRRGGYGSRGGGGPGIYQSRGGGYRGDNWRGRR